MRTKLSKWIIIFTLLTSVVLSPLFSNRLDEFQFLKDKIEKSHKNFFNTIERKECDEEFQRLSKDLENLSYGDYYFTLLSYLALSHDSHTFINSPDIFSYFKYFPLQLNYIGDRAYVVSGLREYRDTMGKEVLSINGVTIKQIEEKASNIFPHDNTVYLRMTLNNYLNNTSFLSFIGVAESEDDAVTIVFSDNSSLSISPSFSSEIKKENLISAVTSYPPYWYTGYYRALAIKNDVLLISYNTCAENPEYPLKTFESDIKSLLSIKKHSAIIVDLRYNGGGNSYLFDPIIKLLKKEKCNKYCLIGAYTFSSAILNAVSLKEKAGFTLIGSPTGGSVNHYGDIKSFTLPETGWEVYYSTKYFKLSNKYDGSLIPDKLIIKDASSYFKGVDREIDYCLNVSR